MSSWCISIELQGIQGLIFLLVLKKIFSMYPLVMKYEAIQSKSNPLDLMCAIRLNKILGMLAVVIPKMLITSRYRGWKLKMWKWMLNYVFILHFYIFLLDWKKMLLRFFCSGQKRFSSSQCKYAMGREKRRSSFLLKKRSIFSNNSIKNLSLVLSLQVHHITSELPLGCWRFTWVPLDSNVSTSTQFTKSFLFSKQWNKSLDCNQAINKC